MSKLKQAGCQTKRPPEFGDSEAFRGRNPALRPSAGKNYNPFRPAAAILARDLPGENDPDVHDIRPGEAGAEEAADGVEERIGVVPAEVVGRVKAEGRGAG
jgi:hypothetical protein